MPSAPRLFDTPSADLTPDAQVGNGMASAETLLELAQRSTPTPMTLDQAYDRVATASHEAAHLLGALAVRAYVRCVYLRRPNSKRGKGGIHASAVHAVEDALISFMGLAHARRFGLEAEGDANTDLPTGQGECRAARVDPDQVLEVAADLLATREAVLHDLTASILKRVNRQGALEGRKLRALMASTLTYVPDVRSRLAALARVPLPEPDLSSPFTLELDLLLGLGECR